MGDRGVVRIRGCPLADGGHASGCLACRGSARVREQRHDHWSRADQSGRAPAPVLAGHRQRRPHPARGLRPRHRGPAMVADPRRRPDERHRLLPGGPLRSARRHAPFHRLRRPVRGRPRPGLDVQRQHRSPVQPRHLRRAGRPGIGRDARSSVARARADPAGASATAPSPFAPGAGAARSAAPSTPR